MESNTENTNSIISGILKQLVAFSGFLGLLSYLLGREYVRGYFVTVGINPALIQLGFSDYVERGWMFLLTGGLQFLMLLISINLLWFAYLVIGVPIIAVIRNRHRKGTVIASTSLYIFLMIYLLLPYIVPFWLGLSNSFKVIFLFILTLFIGVIFYKRKSVQNFLLQIMPEMKKPENSKNLDSSFALITNLGIAMAIGVIGLFFISFWENNAFVYGSKSAFRDVKLNTTPVTLLSTVSISQNGSEFQSVFRQENMRLFTYNNGRYYFFSQVTGDCSPVDMLIVEEASIVSIQRSPAPVPLNCTADPLPPFSIP